MDYSISFDRSVWEIGEFHNDTTGKNLESYLITFPISLTLLLLGVKYFSRIASNKLYWSSIGWFSIVLAINFAFGDLSAMWLKIVFGMIVFSTSLLIFDEYFSDISRNMLSHDQKSNIESFYIFRPFIFTVTVLFCSHVIYMDDTLVFSWLRIYSFDQYLAYSLFLFIGVFFERKWWLIFIFFMVLFFAYAARVDSVKAMLVLIFLAYLIHSMSKDCLNKYSVFFLKLAIFSVVVYQLLSYSYLEISNYFPLALSGRMEAIHLYYSNVNLADLIIPLHDKADIVEYLHNEPLQILSTAGLLGIFFHYAEIYNRIKTILILKPGVGISLAMVIIIGGMLVLPTIHPYTAIIIAYLISFYSKAGLYKGQKQNLNVVNQK